MNTDSRPAAIENVTGTAVVVRGNEIDTDRIIPARYLKVVSFEGLGEFAFNDVRVAEDGTLTDHPFNDSRFAGATVLVVNKNFGCGSSREHAPQALMRWGIAAIVGESFAEIFAGNCNALGIPAVTASSDAIGNLMDIIEEQPGTPVTVNLVDGAVSAGNASFECVMPESYRQALISGSWDTTAVLLLNLDTIRRKAAELPYLGWSSR